MNKVLEIYLILIGLTAHLSFLVLFHGFLMETAQQKDRRREMYLERLRKESERRLTKGGDLSRFCDFDSGKMELLFITIMLLFGVDGFIRGMEGKLSPVNITIADFSLLHGTGYVVAFTSAGFLSIAATCLFIVCDRYRTMKGESGASDH